MHSFIPDKWPYYVFARLLQFFCSAARIAAVPKLLAGVCCRTFYGCPVLPALCWARKRSCALSIAQRWHPCSRDSWGAPCVPQHLWVSHPVASYVLGGFSAQRCRCAVVWQGGDKAIKEDFSEPGQHMAVVGMRCWPPAILGLVLSQGLSNS